jgi:hypothetical protein
MKLEVTVWLEITVWCTHTGKRGGGTWHGYSSNYEFILVIMLLQATAAIGAS